MTAKEFFGPEIDENQTTFCFKISFLCTKYQNFSLSILGAP